MQESQSLVPPPGQISAFQNVFVMQWHFNIKQIYIYICFLRKGTSKEAEDRQKPQQEGSFLQQTNWDKGAGDRVGTGSSQPPCPGFKLEQTDFLVRELPNKSEHSTIPADLSSLQKGRVAWTHHHAKPSSSSLLHPHGEELQQKLALAQF